MVAITSIKVDSRVRDRLRDEALREGVPISRVLDGLLADRERERRFAAIARAMAASSPAEREVWERESRAWDVTSSDGLEAW